MKNIEILWDCQDNVSPDYHVTVLHIGPYQGILVVACKEKVFYTKLVPVTYDAKYGPDRMDLIDWATLAAEVTEAHEHLQGEDK